MTAFCGRLEIAGIERGSGAVMAPPIEQAPTLLTAPIELAGDPTALAAMGVTPMLP